jgi:hypothetical protein
MEETPISETSHWSKGFVFFGGAFILTFLGLQALLALIPPEKLPPPFKSPSSGPPQDEGFFLPPEEKVLEEKRKLQDIPTLELLLLFHRNQSKALKDKYEQLLRDSEMCLRLPLLKKSGTAFTPESPFYSLWIKSDSELQAEAQRLHQKSQLLAKIGNHLKNAKISFLFSTYSLEQLLEELLKREPLKELPPLSSENEEQKTLFLLWYTLSPLFQKLKNF